MGQFGSLTAEQVDRVRALARQHLSWKSIAEIVGTSEWTARAAATGSWRIYQTPGALTADEVQERKAAIYRKVAKNYDGRQVWVK